MLDGNFVEALNNRANALLKAGRHEEALACYERALAIDPRHAEVLNNRGNALAELGRHREALDSVGRAIAANPIMSTRNGTRPCCGCASAILPAVGRNTSCAGGAAKR